MEGDRQRPLRGLVGLFDHPGVQAWRPRRALLGLIVLAVIAAPIPPLLRNHFTDSRGQLTTEEWLLWLSVAAPTATVAWILWCAPRLRPMDEVAARRLSPRLLLGFFVLSCVAAVVLMPSLVQGNEYHGMGSFIRNLIGVWGLTLVGLPVLDVRLAWIPSVTHTLAWLAFGTARPWWTFTARPATDPLSWALSLGILALGLALAPALMGHPRLLRVTRTHLDLL